MVLLVGRMEGRVLANYHYYSNSNAREFGYGLDPN